MKKLIIAAAIVCAAAMSHAGSVRWGASGVTGYNTPTLYSGSATLYAYLATESAASASVIDTADMTDGSIAMQVSDALDSGTYMVYYTMTDAKDNVFTSTAISRAVQKSGNVTISFGSGGTWKAAPEPTSAMLMLLGVAGLALRRRRA